MVMTMGSRLFAERRFPVAVVMLCWTGGRSTECCRGLSLDTRCLVLQGAQGCMEFQGLPTTYGVIAAAAAAAEASADADA